MTLNESYTLNEIQDRITDTRNILSALRDSLYILSSALDNPDEQREEYEDLAYNVENYYIGDVESMIGDFERDAKDIEVLEESIREDVTKEWKPDLRFKHIQSVLDTALNRGKYVNNEREEVMAALDRADKGGYTPEQRKFIRNKHEQMWRKNKNVTESAKGSVDDYLNKMRGKSKSEAEKIVRNAKGNPNAETAYQKYLELTEDTEKTASGKWVNRGDTGETHGEFKTKKEADAQRKAMFANGFKG